MTLREERLKKQNTKLKDENAQLMERIKELEDSLEASEATRSVYKQQRDEAKAAIAPLERKIEELTKRATNAEQVDKVRIANQWLDQHTALGPIRYLIHEQAAKGFGGEERWGNYGCPWWVDSAERDIWYGHRLKFDTSLKSVPKDRFAIPHFMVLDFISSMFDMYPHLRLYQHNGNRLAFPAFDEFDPDDNYKTALVR